MKGNGSGSRRGLGGAEGVVEKRKDWLVYIGGICNKRVNEVRGVI